MYNIIFQADEFNPWVYSNIKITDELMFHWQEKVVSHW